MLKPNIHRPKTAVEMPALHARLVSRSSRAWFYPNELASIYGFPAPSTSAITVAVLSFGGGLFGTVSSSGVLTNGDVQATWTAIGIPSRNHPRVIIQTLGGARNSPVSVNDDGTAENTLDVTMIGACCPSSALTIILYISPNTLAAFPSVLTSIRTTPVIVGGATYRPSIVSLSWGAPEPDWGSSSMTTIDGALAALSSAGVTVCVASGDSGANDGLSAPTVDFPASSPHVVACGGSTLTCPNVVYDVSTTEVAWNTSATVGEGEGVSAQFARPSFQPSSYGSMRVVPDIVMDADPNTGVALIIQGTWYVFGGTSAVSPTVSGFLAALGTPPVFAPPVFYNTSSTGFHTLTSPNTGLGSLRGNVMAAAFPAPRVSVTGISVTPSGSVSVYTNIATTLTARVTPTNATTSAVRWVSSAPGVASVSASGVVMASSPGTTTVTAYATDGTSAAGSVTFTVVGVTRLAISSATVAVRGTTTLTPVVTPSGPSTRPALTWSSSNTRVATVSSAGVVTGVAAGTSVITVRYGSVSGTATITVR